MTLRTTALIAGALGLLLLIAGLIADSARPDDVGTPQAALDTPVLVVGPDEVAIAPGGTIAVEAPGAMVAFTGRTVDVDAWARSRDVTRLVGVPSWEELAVETARSEASSSASPSASPEPSPSGSPSASTEPSPSASPADEAPAEIADIWRESWTATDRLELATAEIPVGLSVVVRSTDGASLRSVELTIPRAVDDAWVSPLKWWGAVLAAFGLLALIWLIVDLRGARSRMENSVAGRRGSGPARPGGRRDRREAVADSGAVPTVAAEPPVETDDGPAEPGEPPHEPDDADREERS